MVCNAKGRTLTTESHASAYARYGLATGSDISHGLDEVDHPPAQGIVQVLEPLRGPSVSIDTQKQRKGGEDFDD